MSLFWVTSSVQLAPYFVKCEVLFPFHFSDQVAARCVCLKGSAVITLATFQKYLQENPNINIKSNVNNPHIWNAINDKIRYSILIFNI